ncbi:MULTISPECIES: helix-turn-helix domain-containing protein [Serratia]|uniref:LuxR family transcriptional regulator n=2 Tax=Serratia liquefaciens TaxID=614 RepID=A0A515D4F6_SERLI|nr:MULTISPECIES: helix-turn-helix transcriptional regulator [Serratia]MBI6163062.1 helix-turn-helix transcriptional regulator [Serratia liquefaciens]MBV0843396.1 helix-turn-helix transcriptional regulator [Serratia liquefaciens]MCS4318632.1 DNA-binding CsgD family transcriptional regulator [Serratia sp. BIGb0234]OKP17155.1 hypothetical protein BSQ35_21150 [Serratia liquefaciens]QDL35289.1 LuxR family transcriptional regulator [Serratia liquefaciens]
MLSYNVIIVGSDKYYAQGLKLLIDKIFIEGGFIGNVSFDKSKLNYADVVFKEVEGDGDCAMSLPLISKGFCGVVFPVFRDVRDVKRGRGSLTCSVFNSGLKFSKRDSTSETVGKIKKYFSQLSMNKEGGYSNALSSTCQSCGKQLLTQCEIDVIELLSAGFSFNSIAYILSRNAKTVYTQKYSAMKKLKLKNNLELTSFICGGANKKRM